MSAGVLHKYPAPLPVVAIGSLRGIVIPPLCLLFCSRDNTPTPTWLLPCFLPRFVLLLLLLLGRNARITPSLNPSVAGASPARRARRLEARPPPHPVRHVRPGAQPGEHAQEVRQGGGGGAREVPPAR